MLHRSPEGSATISRMDTHMLVSERCVAIRHASKGGVFHYLHSLTACPFGVPLKPNTHTRQSLSESTRSLFLAYKVSEQGPAASKACSSRYAPVAKKRALPSKQNQEAQRKDVNRKSQCPLICTSMAGLVVACEIVVRSAFLSPSSPSRSRQPNMSVVR